MWTPKRIVLLVLGFCLFFSAYTAYARSFLGHIDGLPPLPEAYRRCNGCDPLPGPLPPRPRNLTRRPGRRTHRVSG